MHIDDCCGSSFSLVPLLFGDQVACAEYHLCAVRATLPERQRACCLLWKTSRVYGMVFLCRGSARYGSAQRRGSICCFLSGRRRSEVVHYQIPRWRASEGVVSFEEWPKSGFFARVWESMVSYPTSEDTADRNTRCLHCRIQEPLHAGTGSRWANQSDTIYRRTEAKAAAIGEASTRQNVTSGGESSPIGRRWRRTGSHAWTRRSSMQRCLPERETFSLPSALFTSLSTVGVGVTGTRCGLTPLPIEDARTPAATVVDDWAISLVSVGEITPALLRLKMVSGDLPRLGGGTLRRVQVSWLLWSPSLTINTIWWFYDELLMVLLCFVWSIRARLITSLRLNWSLGRDVRNHAGRRAYVSVWRMAERQCTRRRRPRSKYA